MDNIFLNACKTGNKTIVQTFLKKGGINIDKRDPSGNTPLYYVCLKGAKDIVVMLVDNGADINATDNTGNTHLIWAVRNGKTETSLFLISKGADTTVKNNDGYSAFDYATAAGLRDLIEALSGGNVATKDAHGHTPLHRAVYNNQSEVVTALLKADNTNINELADDGMSAIMLAVANSNIAIVEQLLKNGADLSLNLLSGDSVLHYSARIGNRFIGKALIQAGADINGRNSSSVTPLILAASCGHNDYTAMLIEAGADVNATNNSGKSAMAYATDGGYNEIVEQLLMAGAEN